MHKHPSLGVALVLLAALLWGTTGTAQALASGALPAVWFGALRLLVAALFFAVWARLDRTPVASVCPPLAPVLAAGLCMAAYNLAFFAGVRLTGVALGTAVALGSGPVWAGLLQALWTRRWPVPVWWLGTAVAVAGGVSMSLSAGAAGGLRADPLGLGLCLLSGLSWGCYSLLNAELLRHLPAGRVTLWAFGLAAVLALPLAWWDSGWPVLQLGDVMAVLYVGLLTAGVAYLLFSHALRHISAATGVTLALAEPVVAFVLAVLVLGEQPGARTLPGLLLVLAGVGLVVRAELRSARRARAHF
ncbi:MAG: DMT family transporter [Hylemonella sp.]|uniref:DMT family transporter n=1 Tax=Hylemonella sp. TaxID=2066020 RepID=UPI00391AAA7B